MQRKAKIFMNNRSQAVRLPKEFQFRTHKVFIRREGSEVVLSPRRLIGLPTLRRGRLRPPSLWMMSRIFRCRNVSGNALHAGYGHLFLHHEALE
jgi:hypothetical protein